MNQVIEKTLEGSSKEQEKGCPRPHSGSVYEESRLQWVSGDLDVIIP